MITRREFLKLSAASAGALAALRYKMLRAWAQIPGGSLNPGDVTKYAMPLVIPPAMPMQSKSKKFDFYKIAVRQFQQQILPTGYPMTTVWSYGAKKYPGTFNYPAFTIEATQNRPVRVQWMNELLDPVTGNFLPHLLPVDPTLHWANPPQGSDPAYGSGPRDSRPTFSSTPGRYTGPVPIVTHVHGAVGVGDESDGYAEAWYLPPANNIPAGYATEGTWYNYFKGKALQKFSATWAPGTATFQYPNHNRASTIWYHDHALGMTRLNVYAGPAGFYLVRGGPDDVVMDSLGGTAVLPGPAPTVGSNPFGTFYEIPIAIQDRSFNADGSLFYPDTRTFFDEFTGPFIPDSNVSPIWNPEFFGNMMVVNGRTWPFLDVEQRRYRFRFLNGCQSRFLILDFSNIPNVEVWQIGNEGGFLAAPVNITADHGNQLLMGLAERADLIVDFTNVPEGSHILANVGPDEPFGGFPTPASDPDSTGQVMAFNVGPAVAPDPTTPPQFLVLPALAPLPAETLTRPLALIEMMSNVHDGPSEAVLGNVDSDGMAMHKMWADPVSENPAVGDTEVWEFYNFTADAHPMHIHEIVFKVENREGLVLDP
ncbi:MAG TPA: twin-arginine translocation signal domain-containing protein, partial [Anaerolineales bacterium]|nr:twin-arginine translocation signal domain-containing protein [Anaerolineales bacterium]